MALTINESTRQLRDFTCACCGAEADKTWAFVEDDGHAVAVYYATCYHHNGIHEAYIDVILGSWGSNTFDDHLTFGCRVGPVVDSPTPACTLVNGAYAAPDDAIYGHKLSRTEGLQHPRVSEFWSLVNAILEQDALVNRHIYGHQHHGTQP